jgi:alanine dehydrogenase
MLVRLLSELDVRAVAPSLAEILALVELAYRLDENGEVEVPTKIGVHPDHNNSFLHAMPAWVGGARALGMKWVSYYPGNTQHSLPDSSGVIILNDPDHGLPCCIMAGMYITFLRTAACAAIAVKHLVAKPPTTLGLIGCGGLGRSTLLMMTAIFPSISRVYVSSRTAASRESFCEEMQKHGSWTITPVTDPRNAAMGVDVVVTSVPPADIKPINADSIKPGTIFIPLDLVNSWEDDVLLSADQVIADNPEHFFARVGARDGNSFPALQASKKIQDLVAGKLSSTSSANRIFVAVCGIASTDIVVAWEIYRRALAQGVGGEFDMDGRSRADPVREAMNKRPLTQFT